MIGTEKQIRWAQDIVETTQDAYESLVAKYGEAPPPIKTIIEDVLHADYAKVVIESPFRYVKNVNSMIDALAEIDYDTASDWVEI